MGAHASQVLRTRKRELQENVGEYLFVIDADSGGEPDDDNLVCFMRTVSSNLHVCQHECNVHALTSMFRTDCLSHG